MKLQFSILLLTFVGIRLNVIAQTDTLFHKGLHTKLHYGFIIAHSIAVQNTAGSNPSGIEIDFFKQRADTASWKLCHCYPAKGWSFSYFDFDYAVLGHGLTAGYFLEPSYRIGKKTQFRFRGNIGFSYLTKPFHSQQNPTNVSYSSHLSGYLQLGVSSGYQIGRRWLLSVGAQYQHVSNGGLKEPNKGINWPTASLGLTWYNNEYNLPEYKKLNNKDFRKQKPYVETGGFFSAKQGSQPDGKSARTPLIGLLVQVTKQIGRTNALTTGLETYYDNALRQKLQKDSVRGSGVRAGWLAGHEFLLGKFFFSQQLGIYIINRNPYYDRIYHRWVLRYQLNKNWTTGIGFNAHLEIADFIDIRLMYKFL